MKETNSVKSQKQIRSTFKVKSILTIRLICFKSKFRSTNRTDVKMRAFYIKLMENDQKSTLLSKRTPLYGTDTIGE